MKKPVVQTHHLIYENEEHNQKEVTGRIYKGEHWIITHLNRRKNISSDFIKSLELWLVLNKDKAIKLKE
jgi:hypothetical protein